MRKKRKQNYNIWRTERAPIEKTQHINPSPLTNITKKEKMQHSVEPNKKTLPIKIIIIMSLLALCGLIPIIENTESKPPIKEPEVLHVEFQAQAPHENPTPPEPKPIIQKPIPVEEPPKPSPQPPQENHPEPLPEPQKIKQKPAENHSQQPERNTSPQEETNTNNENQAPQNQEQQNNLRNEDPGTLGEIEPASSTKTDPNDNKKANEPPQYPEISIQRHEQGQVTLHLMTDENGHVCAGRVEKSSGYYELDKSAIEAAKNWNFEARSKDFDYVVNFNLDQGVQTQEMDNE